MECLKQVVTATISRRGKVLVVGKNDISNDEVTECPRKGMKSGEGYELCTSICGQKGHAEFQAIERAKELGIDIKGASMAVEGHSYICDNCEKEIMKASIRDWYIKKDK
jgi:deoxycytidylate deaminase